MTTSSTITHPANIGEVLNKLTHVKKLADGWTADCPCPGHNTPSGHLSIKDADDKALVTCFSTHTYEDICKALGYDSLTYSHDGPAVPPRRQLVKTYDYPDEDGRLLFQTCRYTPKDFNQRRPDPAKPGEWIWDLKGVRLVLYRLPEIKAMILNGMTVYVAEGEKDCDRMWEYGLPATTNPLGAGKWKPEYSEMLRGADVVICGDNDRPGLKHVSEVAASLQGKTNRVRILTLPAHVKDISEWFDADGDVNHLFKMIDDAIDFTPEALPDDGKVKMLSLADVKPEIVGWLWRPYLPLGKLSILEGDPGEGKSAVSLAISTAVTLGKGLPPAHDAAVPSGNVIYMTAEDGLKDTIVPRLIDMGADRSRIFSPDRLFSLDDEGLLLLELEIRERKPVLVVIDPIMAYMPTDLDTRLANHVRHVLGRIGYLADKYHVSILIIRHLTKSPTMKGLYRGSGSIDFAAAARSILLAGADVETGDRALVHTKSNLAVKGEAIGYALSENDLGGLHFEWLGHTEVSADKILAGDDRRTAVVDAKDFLLDVLAGGEMAEEDIQAKATEQGIKSSTLRNAKKQLGVKSRNEGIPGKKGAGKWYWSLPPEKDRGEQTEIPI